MKLLKKRDAETAYNTEANKKRLELADLEEAIIRSKRSLNELEDNFSRRMYEMGNDLAQSIAEIKSMREEVESLERRNKTLVPIDGRVGKYDTDNIREI